jgi:3-hydroxybutyryl-CoA dehydrogenase
VRLSDVDVETAQQGLAAVRGQLRRLVEKGRLADDARDAILARIHVARGPAELRDCELLIEAVFEDLETKVRVLRELLPHLSPGAIIATNTSSFSVGEIGERIGAAEHTCGMHFFNPAPVMRLVEIIAGPRTDPAVADRAAAIAVEWGKTVARAADVPGFIVNHVARPYYLEAFRILEEGWADAAEIDAAMRRLGRFRMGPLELTDLIGQDVNAATTRSVWERLDRPPLLRPSPLQERLVAEGQVGRKSGRGVYRYDEDEPVPAIVITRTPAPADPALRAAADAFTAAASSERGTPLERLVFARILAAVIVQAQHAVARAVASAADVDLAMREGANWPHGPLEWAQRIGWPRVAALVAALTASGGDDRFAAAPSAHARA